MARLDRLGPVKEVAQLAATLGRTFSHELLAAVSQLEANALDDALTQLAQAELIYCRALPPRVTYEFKHALVQDTAYRSLLKATRQQFHQRIATVLETQFPETADNEPEVLAHHFTEAGLTDQAVRYWQCAGERATERSANQEAIAHLSRALELLEFLPESPGRDQLELTLQIDLGGPILMTRGHTSPEVERVYSRARMLGQKVGETPQLIPALFGLWRYYGARPDFQAARELGEQLLRLGEGSQDPANLIHAHYALGFTQLFAGEPALARTHLEIGSTLYNREQRRALVFRLGQDPGVACLVWASLALWVLGYPDTAAARCQQGVELAKELSHPFSLAFALCYRACVHTFCRDAESVRECTEAALNISREHEFSTWVAIATVYRGWALARLDHVCEGIDELHSGLNAVRGIGLGVLGPYYLSLLAEAYGAADQTDKAVASLNQALAEANENGESWWEAELHRMKGEFFLHSSKKAAEAEACFTRAIAVARRQRAKSLELRAATSVGRLWQAQGKREQAHDLLAQICDWFTEGFDTEDLRKAKDLLDSLP